MLDPLRDAGIGDQPTSVRSVVESLQDFGVRSEALHPKRDDDRATGPGSLLDVAANALLRVLALLRPILAQRFDAHGSERQRAAHAFCPSIEMREPALVLRVVARSVREDQHVFALRLLAQ